MGFCQLRMSAAAALCLSLALMAHPEPSASSEVPAPVNLSVFSFNLNTTLYWNYSRPADSPYFQLEIWNEGKRSWSVIEHCRKILHTYCDVSHEITEPIAYYRVRVKAIVGTEESNYTLTEINLMSAVPAPSNLTITSYNFNTTLHWKYSRLAKSASFTVEILEKGQKKWMVIEACRNTLHHYCDLSFNIIEPYEYYKTRVKAKVGNKESSYTLTEFALVNIGIIGPPHVNGSIQDKMIVIDIWHPHVPPVLGRKTVRDYAQFNYIVYYGNSEEETDFCDHEACSSEILIKDQLFCFYVQGKSQDLPMTTEKSEKICINEEAKGASLQVAIIIILPVICALLLLFFIGYFIYRKVIQDPNKMPQALSSVVRNIASNIHSLPQNNPEYDPVAISPIDSPDDQTTFEEEQINTDVMAQSTSNGSAYPPYPNSLAETDVKSEDEANSGNNYFHKECTSGDSSSVFGTREVLNISQQEPEQSRHVPIVPNPSGYDKPHWCKTEIEE